MINKNFNFSSTANSIDALWEDEDIAIVSLDLFHIDESEDDHNRNMCNISMESALNSISTFYNKSITFRYNSICKDFVSDITEHANNESELFETRVAGHIPTDSKIEFIKRDNGKTYCNAQAVIHKRYLPQLMKILENNNGELKVSIEIACEGEQNEDNGIFYVSYMKLQTVMILSPKVVEGIENSHLNVLKFSQQDINAMNSKYMQFSLQSKSEENTNIFTKIKNKKMEANFVASLGMRALEERLWQALKHYTYTDGSWNGKRYYIKDVLPDSKEVIVHDNQTDEIYKIPYKVSKDGDVTVKEEDKVKIAEDKNYRELKNSFYFKKEDYGDGETIKVDKSKDAMSESAWGNTNKTTLRNKVLEAKNYKSLVNDVYLRVEDGWEDAPSEKLGYPIMEIKGSEAVYNRYGLASALAYAEGQNDDEIVDKIKKIYKKLGLDEKEKENKMEDKKNKVDKDNPELDKIRDDIESDEDDEKEKLKGKEKKNAKGVDDKEDDKLKDDEDSDKDYWKKKYRKLEKEFGENMEDNFRKMSKDITEYKCKEDKELMSKYLKSYKKCFADDEYEVIAKEIENAKREDFEKSIDEKVKAFVRKMSEDEEDLDDDEDDEKAMKKNKKDMKNSFMPNPFMKEKSNSVSDLDGVLSQLGVK